MQVVVVLDAKLLRDHPQRSAHVSKTLRNTCKNAEYCRAAAAGARHKFLGK